MTDFFKKRVTIYNDIEADAVNPRRFERAVIDRCSVQGGIVSKADGTVENIVNATTIIMKDTERYRTPLVYKKTPVDIREDLYTVQIGDFVVFDEVGDIVSTSRDFAALQEKYADNGMVIRSVSVNIFGMPVDNVTATNA